MSDIRTSDHTGAAFEQIETRKGLEAESARIAQAQAQARWAQRAAADAKAIEDRSAERRRWWDITAAEWKIVCRLTHLFKYVEDQRRSGDMHAAVRAHQHLAARVAVLAPCNPDGTAGRIYRFAAIEAENRGIVGRDYFDWSHDVTLGYFDQYKPAPEPPAPAPEAATSSVRCDVT